MPESNDTTATADVNNASASTNPDDMSFEQFLAAEEAAETPAPDSGTETAPQTPPAAESQGKEGGEGSVEGTAPETTPESAPEAVSTEPQLPAELAALAQREQAAFQLQETAKKQLESANKAEQALKEAVAADPLGTIQEKFGLDYETLTRHAVKDPGVAQNAQLSKLQATMETMQRQMQEQQALIQQQQAAAANTAYEQQAAAEFQKLQTQDGEHQYPLAHAFYGENVGAHIRNVAEVELQQNGKKPAFADIAKTLEQGLAQELTKLKGNKHALALLTGDTTPQSTNPNQPISPPQNRPTGTATESLGTTPAGQTTDTQKSVDDMHWDEFMDSLPQEG